jgi:4-hydroxyacetophenone monooxygenase
MLAQISKKSLIDKVIPNYPPFGKRMLQDNGAWLEALHLPNVTLLAEGVEQMNSRGIIGLEKEYEFDTVVFATGFKAQDFLILLILIAAQAVLKAIYKDSPVSYLGITFSIYSKFFCYVWSWD